MTSIDDKYYVNVKELHELQRPKCNLPRPQLKGVIEDDEFIPLLTIEVEH